LPILIPDLLAGDRPSLIGYAQAGEIDWRAKIERALTIARDPEWSREILSWDEVAGQIEKEVA
jgi:hypothetical protein